MYDINYLLLFRKIKEFLLYRGEDKFLIFSKKLYTILSSFGIISIRGKIRNILMKNPQKSLGSAGGNFTYFSNGTKKSFEKITKNNI